MALFNVTIRKYAQNPTKSNVVVEINHQRIRWRMNTQLKVNAQRIGCTYDDDINLFKLHSLTKLTEKEKNELKDANELIKAIQDKLSKIIKDLILSLVPYTTEQIKQLYFQPDEKAPAMDKPVIEWYKEFIKLKEAEIGEGINSYRSTHEHYIGYTQNMGTLYLKHLDRIFFDGFRMHLRNTLQGATINKQFKNIKIFLNWVKSTDDYNEIAIPTAYKKIKIKSRFGDPIGLSVNQFIEFSSMNLSNRPELERTRDLMVFGISIGGPRHGDLQTISQSLRKHGYTLNKSSITYYESKTGNEHKDLFVNKFGLSVLEKYQPFFPYVPSNARMNTNLKTIATILQWTEIKQIPRYDEFGKLIEVEEVPLKDIFSSKFMRKTAATIDNYLGVPTKTSMHRTGHKTFAAFSRYVDVNKDSLDQANEKWDSLFEKVKL